MKQVKLVVFSLYASALLLLSGCKGLAPESLKANEMVYASRAGNQLIAYEVNLQDGTLMQVDILLMSSSSGRLRVSKDGRYLFAALRDSQDSSYVAAIALTRQGHFASAPVRLVDLDGSSEFELSADSAFLITNVYAGRKDKHHYYQSLSTYRIDSSVDSIRVTPAGNQMLELCEWYFWCSDHIWLGITAYLTDGTLISIHFYSQAGLAEPSTGTLTYEIDAVSGALKAGHFAYGAQDIALANSIASVDYFFGRFEPGYEGTTGLISVNSESGKVWSCGGSHTVPTPPECVVGKMALHPSGDFLFTSTAAVSADYPLNSVPNSRLWSHPFSFTQGIDLNAGHSLEVPYYPDLLLTSSKGSVLVGYDSFSSSGVPAGQMFVYRVNPTTKELQPMPMQAPLPDHVLALAVR